MKRRSRMGRHRFGTPQRKALNLFGRLAERKRKGFSFERLEDRLVFSTTPIGYEPQVFQNVSFSASTPEGQAQALLRETEWAALQGQAAAAALTISGLPNDPLFASQWHLLNTGQEVGNPDLQNLFGLAGEDINVVPVWNMGITGEGVTVAVIDTGVQVTHPDLVENISPTLRLNASTGTSNASPTLGEDGSFHGTSVAGIIGAVANNEIGGVGVAPGVTIVPIKLDFSQLNFDQQVVNALQYALQNDIDITNNSYGPTGRFISPLTPEQATILRQAALFGRGGLGMINVFSSGNDGGPFYDEGFGVVGHYNSTSYDGRANSRYVIAVTGTDENGQYVNPDGTFTSYPEIGPNVLVAAPTGSNGVLSVAEDDGFGSGIWTTDLVGDFGRNAAPLPNGFDPDNDPLEDPDYTSRFNGTSAAAPMVAGVIALMLEANPNLTLRDVQEILVRSARQNAEFETPSSGQLLGPRTTWQVNQVGPFRDPDPWHNPLLYPLPILEFPFDALYNPLAEPNLEGFGGANFYGVDTNDGERQSSSRYESQPPLFTNGAGYTVSQGYGIYSEQTGYAHGVVDAELAVLMAKQWHTLGQNSAPNTEKTYTTSVISGGGSSFNLPAAEKTANDNGALLIPGGIGGLSGFNAYWNEFFADVTFDDQGVPDPSTGPFSGDDPPANTRGFSYIDFSVPPPQQISVEWVDVKLHITGPSDGVNNLRIMLTSPDGTQSDFTEYWPDISNPISFQPISTPGDAGNSIWDIEPGPLTADGSDFIWTFSSNRHWGETTNAAAVMDPITGEPELDFFDQPIFRNWELHIENWGNTALGLNSMEVVWHGKPIAGSTYDPNYGDKGVANAQRIQGFVGIDSNGDEQFNFGRFVQTVIDTDGDPETTRLLDVTRSLDYTDNNLNGVYDAGDVINQEKFAENIIVDAYRVWDGVAEATPVARFITGADGNYYFDVDVQGDLAQTTVPGNVHFGQDLTYQVRISDPLDRAKLEDIDTPNLSTSNPLYTYLPHYRQVWDITPDWFFAPDRDNPLTLSNNPGEIFFDPSTGAPVPFTGAAGTVAPVPMAVKNINFLLKQDAPVQQFDVIGTVYADFNGNGVFDGDDTPAPGILVYQDVNRNGVADPGEQRTTTDQDGQYTLTISASQAGTYQVGVIPPTPQWLPTDPGQDGVQSVFAGPGSPDQVVNFFLDPPADATPDDGEGNGTLQGVVFSDGDSDGVRDAADTGVAGFRVFIDANENGIWDSATERSALTGENGAFFFTDVTPGVVRLDIVVPNEGTSAAAWVLTAPALGFHQVTLGEGGNIAGLNFGLDNRADDDWGDLPDSYKTTAAAGGPHHTVVPGFQLGNSIDGEVDGVPTILATGEGQTGDNDDGVLVVSNGGFLQTGTNTLRVTVAGVGGLLTGWMDFNNDGQFDESERLAWTLNGTVLGGEADLNPGTYDLQITIPASAPSIPTAARFRWGEQGLSFTGPATIGEVEDYRFGLNFLLGDYNRNGRVDQPDYNVWRSTQGQTVTPFAGADGNGDGIINDGDLDVWRANFGNTMPVPGAGAGAATLVVDNSSGDPSSSAFAPVFASVGESVGLGSRGSYRPPMADSTSNSNLLLVDLALADSNHSAYSDVDDSLVGEQQDDANANDLALAAAVNDDANWWDSI